MKKSYSKDPLDRFYTNSDLAKKLIQELDVSGYDLVVEPSAGSGGFSLLIPNCLAFDISLQHPSIIQQDFLEYKYEGDVPRDKILCIGNPPYGRQSSLAIKFIKKCAEFADTIAFIRPLSFNKPSVQSKLPLTYHLIKSLELNWDSFTLNSESYSVPCVFQIWKNLYENRVKLPKISPIGYRYVNKDEADIAVRRVGVYAGKAYFDLNKSAQSHYFLKFDIPIWLPAGALLNEHVWSHNNTVGPRSISKPELNTVLNPIVAAIVSPCLSC